MSDASVHRNWKAVSAGGTASSALVVDLTSERHCTRVLAVVWSLRLIGVLLCSALVNQLFGSACKAVADRVDVLMGLRRLFWVAPPMLVGLGVVAVIGVERRSTDAVDQHADDRPALLSLSRMLKIVLTVPKAASFLAVLCLLAFSMFLNDAVLEPYGAALFGMNVCDTTFLNAVLAVGFLAGLLSSGFQVVPRFGMIRGSQVAAPQRSDELLRIAVALFGVSLGICIHSCLNLMFTFVQPGLNAVLLGLWGVGYANSRGLATVSGGGLLTLLKTINGGDVIMSYGGVFGLQILFLLSAVQLLNRLGVQGFRLHMNINLARVAPLISD